MSDSELTLVRIKWDDPFGHPSAWTEVHELEYAGPHTTVGYLIEDHPLGPDWIVIVGTLSGIEGQYGDVNCVLRKLVVSQEELGPRDATNFG